ncbi:unnamed protein product [Protopolystoma xenopodis]|uniref:Uncharacterized protein n=1 Tax=Protopolystoma xenopodis TaxID=117903 RepID=A0A448XD21_9PLAT|nr:unnamed protein product [Protopolystoma xenopodis]
MATEAIETRSPFPTLKVRGSDETAPEVVCFPTSQAASVLATGIGGSISPSGGVSSSNSSPTERKQTIRNFLTTPPEASAKRHLLDPAEVAFEANTFRQPYQSLQGMNSNSVLYCDSNATVSTNERYQNRSSSQELGWEAACLPGLNRMCSSPPEEKESRPAESEHESGSQIQEEEDDGILVVVKRNGETKEEFEPHSVNVQCLKPPRSDSQNAQPTTFPSSSCEVPRTQTSDELSSWQSFTRTPISMKPHPVEPNELDFPTFGATAASGCASPTASSTGQRVALASLLTPDCPTVHLLGDQDSRPPEPLSSGSRLLCRTSTTTKASHGIRDILGESHDSTSTEGLGRGYRRHRRGSRTGSNDAEQEKSPVDECEKSQLECDNFEAGEEKHALASSSSSSSSSCSSSSYASSSAVALAGHPASQQSNNSPNSEAPIGQMVSPFPKRPNPLDPVASTSLASGLFAQANLPNSLFAGLPGFQGIPVLPGITGLQSLQTPQAAMITAAHLAAAAAMLSRLRGHCLAPLGEDANSPPPHPPPLPPPPPPPPPPPLPPRSGTEMASESQQPSQVDTGPEVSEPDEATMTEAGSLLSPSAFWSGLLNSRSLFMGALTTSRPTCSALSGPRVTVGLDSSDRHLQSPGGGLSSEGLRVVSPGSLADVVLASRPYPDLSPVSPSSGGPRDLTSAAMTSIASLDDLMSHSGAARLFSTGFFTGSNQDVSMAPPETYEEAGELATRPIWPSGHLLPPGLAGLATSNSVTGNTQSLLMTGVAQSAVSLPSHSAASAAAAAVAAGASQNALLPLSHGQISLPAGLVSSEAAAACLLSQTAVSSNLMSPSSIGMQPQRIGAVASLSQSPLLGLRLCSGGRICFVVSFEEVNIMHSQVGLTGCCRENVLELRP